MPSANARAVASVASDVLNPRTSSHSFIIGTGEKKWVPTTASGRAVTAAIWVTGIARRVRRQDRAVLAELVQRPEHLVLDLELLEHRLDHDVRVGDDVEIGGRGDPAERRLDVGLGDLLLLRELGQRGLDPVQPRVQRRLIEVADRHVPAGLRGHLRDAGTHQSGADDGEPSGHVCLPLINEFEATRRKR